MLVIDDVDYWAIAGCLFVVMTIFLVDLIGLMGDGAICESEESEFCLNSISSSHKFS